MTHAETPCFLDFEASGLGRLCYPIEVAWCAPGGEMESWLIRPDPRWLVEDSWEASAQAMHGISQDALQQGVEPAWLAAYMNAQLEGRVVYADGLPFDRLWLDQLFDSAGLARRFEIADFYELIYQQAPPHITHRDGWMEQLRLAAMNRLRGLQWHRAENDVRRLMESYQIALGRDGRGRRT